MKFSIIIPVGEVNEYITECIEGCLKQDYSDLEIIVLPDKRWDSKFEKTRIIPTGKIPPSDKRDIGIKEAKGEILAFLDDDTIPKSDWLANAIKYFEDENVAAVGGPAITPESDNDKQKASGLVFSSLMVGGNYAYRYIPKEKREVDDYPSCNLLVRKNIIDEIGGFDTKYWPGEDTKLCLDITKKLKKKIIYAPDVSVWHHRRELFMGHLKQVARYAKTRGIFVRKFPETSLRISYFLPSLFVFGFFIGLVLSFFSSLLSLIFVSCMSIYLIAALFTSIKTRDMKLTPLVFMGIIATHFVYGIMFTIGLLSQGKNKTA